jgi:anti-anti-sigma factor
MEITEGSAGAVKVAGLKGRLDTATAPIAEAALLPMLAGGAKLVLDLGEMHHVSSAGLRVLLKVARDARASGGAVALAAPQAPVRDMLETSGFDRVLPIHATRAEAVAGLG